MTLYPLGWELGLDLVGIPTFPMIVAPETAERLEYHIVVIVTGIFLGSLRCLDTQIDMNAYA